MALLLKEHGIKRVRPLEGGLDAWRSRGYPIDPAAAGADPPLPSAEPQLTSN